MAVNSGLAHVSDTLFTTAIATYTLAMGAYTAEYAFGRRGHIAATTTFIVARPVRRLCALPVRDNRSHRPASSGWHDCQAGAP